MALELISKKDGLPASPVHGFGKMYYQSPHLNITKVYVILGKFVESTTPKSQRHKR